MQFILRMRDEASAGIRRVRDAVKGTGDAASSANPQLGAMGERIGGAAKGFSQAREAMMKVVGLGAMVVGTFMAVYKAARPVGDYIRRMWDDAAASEYEANKNLVKMKETIEAQKDAAKREADAVERITGAYDKQADAAKRVADAKKSLAAAAKSGVTGSEATAELNAARELAGLRSATITDLEQRLYDTAQQKDAIPEKWSDDAKARQNAVIDTRLAQIRTALEGAKIAYQEAEDAVAAALVGVETGRKNDNAAALEAVKKRASTDLKLRLENVGKELDAWRDGRAKAEDRLSRAKDASKQAWGWYRDKDSFRDQLAEEKAQAEAEAQFAREAAALQDRRERASRSMFGDRGMALSEGEQVVQRVLAARAEEAEAAGALVRIEENTRNLSDIMEKLLALKQ